MPVDAATSRIRIQGVTLLRAASSIPWVTGLGRITALRWAVPVRITVELSRPGGPKAGGVAFSDLLDALKRQLATASTHPYQVCTCHMCSSGSLLPELLGKPDENSFGAPDVAEPIRVFVLDHFADELRAAFAEPGERIVDVLHGEHDA